VAIHVICPHCETRASAPDDSAGTTLSCPHCSKPFTVPSPRSYPVREEEPPPSRRRRDDEDDFDDRPSRRRARDFEDDDDRPRRRGFHCPHCGSDEPPVVRKEISAAGWVVFVVMLLVCLPLFFIGLLMQEEYRVCRECGTRLG
jgi:hypothetical protein